MGQMLTIFAAVFLAELGDKTQLATVLFASKENLSAIHVFLAASAALCLSTALAVFLGNVAGHLLDRLPVKLIAGIGFMVIGGWTIYDHLRTAT